ncbi:MAG: hypothetical protein M1813_007168 [Trichoglossum hirsutum]|nr:MAG: hypothetical protein M1813_007168 [Trichoglossum hirsutum]
MKSTSGEGFRTSSVGDALIGARRWDDIQVQKERDILLGADDKSAFQLAEEIRERLVKAFLDAFPYVWMNEERAYRDRSYFHNKHRPRLEADRDESSLSSEELSHMSLGNSNEDIEEIEKEGSESEFD